MADRKMRILIVDDANLVRLYYRQTLEGAGFEVEEALNGIEALERLLASPADAVIVDINMPLMDGRKCLSEIKKIERLKRTPVFIYSTSSESRLKEELIHMGATDYIEKPSSISSLSAIISGLYARVEKMMEG